MATGLRVWIALVSAVVLPALATGQTSQSQTHRIGLLTWFPCEVPTYLEGKGEFSPFIRGLVEYGYKPGESISIECRSAGQRYENLVGSAKELVNRNVDIIVTMSQPA